jgi:hypothetical protein
MNTPMKGTWVLVAPNGREYTGLSPIQALRAEQEERVPADVALANVLAANEPDFAERHVRLSKFYQATNTDDLIDKMEAHITKLQNTVLGLTTPFSFAPQRVREG